MILPDANRPREEIIAGLLVAMRAANLTEESALYPLIITMITLMEHDRSSIEMISKEMAATASGLVRSFRLLETRIELMMAETRIDSVNQSMSGRVIAKLEERLDLVLRQLSYLTQTLTSPPPVSERAPPVPVTIQKPKTHLEKGLDALDYSNRHGRR